MSGGSPQTHSNGFHNSEKEQTTVPQHSPQLDVSLSNKEGDSGIKYYDAHEEHKLDQSKGSALDELNESRHYDFGGTTKILP